MCGRFTLNASPSILARLFLLDEEPEGLAPRFNIAPSQSVAVVLPPTAGPGRRLTWHRWGLIPSWAKDPKIGARMINARAETVAEKPAFRAAFRRRRCLVPADGFYEWTRAGDHKRPWHIRMRDGSPFAFAGLWESWRDPDGGQSIDTCTLLTTTPNDLIAPIHHRMPVILAPGDHDPWLTLETEPARLLAMLQPFDAGAMEAFPVSHRVNNPAVDESDLIRARQTDPG